MDGATLVVALGATISVLVSLASLGLAIVSYTRPQRDVERIQAKVNDLTSLRTEWENTLAALDSMNKRSARLARLEANRENRDREPQPEVAAAASGPLRRTLSLAELGIGGSRKE